MDRLTGHTCIVPILQENAKGDNSRTGAVYLTLLGNGVAEAWCINVSSSSVWCLNTKKHQLNKTFDPVKSF